MAVGAHGGGVGGKWGCKAVSVGALSKISMYPPRVKEIECEQDLMGLDKIWYSNFTTH